MSIEASKSESSNFNEKILKEKQKFWDNEGSNRNVTGTKTNTAHSSRGQYISLFIVTFIASVALSSYVLFNVIGVK